MVAEQVLSKIRMVLPYERVHLPRLFAFLESSRGEFGVEDFSVTQTSLEQVFISFARHQAGPSQ